MSLNFRQRLLPYLANFVKEVPTPFYILDHQGIVDTARQLQQALGLFDGYVNFFALKALPEIPVLELLLQEGMGVDCSSIAELNQARDAGAPPERIMFTSNNTSLQEFAAAMSAGGCILNLDDIGLVAKVPEPFPRLICFRYNPGPRRSGLESVIGNPETCKYGVPHEQIVQAYRLAQERGATKFGLHTMVVSNERDYRCFVETTTMLLEVVKMISAELGIRFEFVNIGGGFGIPYKPEDQPLDLASVSAGIAQAMESFEADQGYQPKLFTECGRFVTGPHGVLVTTCINRMSKYREFAGVDACATSTIMRPPMYHPNGGYHHITVHNRRGQQKNGANGLRLISVVGSACEDNDRFAWERESPEVEEGDLVLIHDAGAHSMGNNYNGRRRVRVFLFRPDGRFDEIRRDEELADLFATQHLKPGQVISRYVNASPLALQEAA